MSNNFPLRGGKNTIWEGGTRVDCLIHGAGLKKTGYVSQEKIHAVDWLPTLVSYASGKNWTELIPENEPKYELGDGMDVLEMIQTGSKSARSEIMHECHESSEN